MVISSTEVPDYIDMVELDTFATFYFSNALTLMKLRQKATTRLSKLPKGVFGCIVEYCQPARIKRVTDHKYENVDPKKQTHIWPRQLSYENPVSKVFNVDYYNSWYFQLQSGQKNDSRPVDRGWSVLNWQEINYIHVKYGVYYNKSQLTGFEFYNSQKKSILKIGSDGSALWTVNLRQGERVVGYQAHRDDVRYSYLQLIIIGPL